MDGRYHGVSRQRRKDKKMPGAESDSLTTVSHLFHKLFFHIGYTIFYFSHFQDHKLFY